MHCTPERFRNVNKIGGRSLSVSIPMQTIDASPLQSEHFSLVQSTLTTQLPFYRSPQKCRIERLHALFENQKPQFWKRATHIKPFVSCACLHYNLYARLHGCFFSFLSIETLRLPEPWVHQEVHRPKLSEKTHEKLPNQQEGEFEIMQLSLNIVVLNY